MPNHTTTKQPTPAPSQADILARVNWQDSRGFMQATPAPPLPPAYMTLAEAALFMRCSKRTLLRYIADGKISFLRLGKRYLFKSADLTTGLKSHRVSTVEEILA